MWVGSRIHWTTIHSPWILDTPGYRLNKLSMGTTLKTRNEFRVSTGCFFSGASSQLLRTNGFCPCVNMFLFLACYASSSLFIANLGYPAAKKNFQLWADIPPFHARTITQITICNVISCNWEILSSSLAPCLFGILWIQHIIQPYPGL